MNTTEDGVAEKLWRSWLAGYKAGGRSWRDGSEMRCPKMVDRSAYESGWLEGKPDRYAIATKQAEQYTWRAAFFSVATPVEQNAAKAKADKLGVEIKAMNAATRERRRRPPSKG